ncbi:hypothetical protein ABPG72_007365 [Tetrahymena utriculariae]
MEDNFDSDLFINKDYVEKEFKYKDCVQKYKASASASTDFDLTGQIVWRAAEQLAEFIVENKEIFRDKVVLELGAGVGLSGLVCAQYAKQVYVTDGNDIVCELMEMNAQYAQNNNVVMEKYCWGDNSYLEKRKDVKFDIIIGADIMFWESSIEPLAITLKQAYELYPQVLVYTATRVRARHSEDRFDQRLKERNLERIVLYSEGENKFYKIYNQSNNNVQDSDLSRYVIPQQKKAELNQKQIE